MDELRHRRRPEPLGLTFWALSEIWAGAVQQPVNYIVRTGHWTFAFLPGFLALLA